MPSPPLALVIGVTAARIAEAAKDFQATVAGLPKPYVAVLLGGTSHAFSFKPQDAAALGTKLAQLVRHERWLSAGHAIAPHIAGCARRLLARRRRVPHIIWDGTGDNPYFGFLGIADAIVVTGDSVNMVTEAAGTGKPVFVQALKGRSARLARFHRLMQERGATRPFTGRLATWTYEPINDTELIASAVRRALGLDVR